MTRSKTIECSVCRRKFRSLAAYLWHFKVVGGCCETNGLMAEVERQFNNRHED